MEPFPQEPDPEDAQAEIIERLQGIDSSPELSPEEVERIDGIIEGFLEVLNGEEYSDMWYDFPGLQEEWYLVEMQAKTGKDRIAAKKVVEDFIEKLKSMKK